MSLLSPFPSLHRRISRILYRGFHRPGIKKDEKTTKKKGLFFLSFPRSLTTSRAVGYSVLRFLYPDVGGGQRKSPLTPEKTSAHLNRTSPCPPASWDSPRLSSPVESDPLNLWATRQRRTPPPSPSRPASRLSLSPSLRSPLPLVLSLPVRFSVCSFFLFSSFCLSLFTFLSFSPY